MNCLNQALKDKRKSMSFPALGTGNLGYPTNEVAEIMLRKIKQFGIDHPEGCLKEVNIVIYEKDLSTYEVTTIFNSILYKKIVVEAVISLTEIFCLYLN